MKKSVKQTAVPRGSVQGSLGTETKMCSLSGRPRVATSPEAGSELAGAALQEKSSMRRPQSPAQPQEARGGEHGSHSRGRQVGYGRSPIRIGGTWAGTGACASLEGLFFCF